MGFFFRTYRLLNILSIDVAAGAVISSLFFARILSVSVLPQGLMALGLTVWAIYTADHLVDAKRIKQTASTERHRFHQTHFKALCVLLAVALLADAVLVFSIREIVFINGFVLGVGVLVYFLVQNYLKWLKELTGALLYAGGVLLIPLSMTEKNLATAQLLLLTQFVLVALINLLLFSWIDLQQDKRDRHASFATTMGNSRTRNLLVILFSTQLILFFVQLMLGEMAIQLILLSMNILLFAIFAKRHYFEKDGRYRLLGDAVFFLPLIYFFL
ncbi:MAG: hypothetical protein JST43_10560 [Bacteroidetes bacterium]|nr:hypothetical protein [Bacteroidota bacterium]MBS1540178.1 hypothetical protein [Bacteroidota bacterium]